MDYDFLEDAIYKALHKAFQDAADVADAELAERSSFTNEEQAAAKLLNWLAGRSDYIKGP